MTMTKIAAEGLQIIDGDLMNLAGGVAAVCHPADAKQAARLFQELQEVLPAAKATTPVAEAKTRIAAALKVLLCHLEAKGEPASRTLSSEPVLFYGSEFYVLSNFSSFRLHWQGADYDTSEHAYQCHKFADKAIRKRIASARSAHDAFKIAEAHKSDRYSDWDDIKFGVMRDILWSKVMQHEYVRRKLLETGERELIEDSWRDGVWGWGEQKNGLNMLGKLWMEIRAEIRGEGQSNEQAAE